MDNAAMRDDPCPITDGSWPLLDRVPCEAGQNTSILDLQTRTASGTGPNAALQTRALAFLLLGRPSMARIDSGLVQRLPKDPIVSATDCCSVLIHSDFRTLSDQFVLVLPHPVARGSGPVWSARCRTARSGPSLAVPRRSGRSGRRRRGSDPRVVLRRPLSQRLGTGS